MGRLASRMVSRQREEILEGVQRVVHRHIKADVVVADVTDLQRDLRLDSMQRLTMIVELENHFRVCFEQDDEAGIITVGDVVSLIQRRRQERAGMGSPGRLAEEAV